MLPSHQVLCVFHFPPPAGKPEVWILSPEIDKRCPKEQEEATEIEADPQAVFRKARLETLKYEAQTRLLETQLPSSHMAWHHPHGRWVCAARRGMLSVRSQQNA